MHLFLGVFFLLNKKPKHMSIKTLLDSTFSLLHFFLSHTHTQIVIKVHSTSKIQSLVQPTTKFLHFLDFPAKNMEMDFWGSRTHTPKHQRFYTLQAGRLGNSGNHLTMDGDDDDVGAWFPCPFCYVEIELPVLCCHLQAEHCFDFKNAVCPICAANLGKDAISHFTTHHVHSIKRRRKSPKSGSWSNGTNLTREIANRGNMHETTPDPLSAFLYNVPISELQEDEEPSATSDVKSSTNEEVDIKDNEEKRQRAAFVQQLVYSTIF